MRPKRSARGFTLIEVLIAVAIVAVIATLGYRALASLSDAETRLTAEATRWRTLDLFFARLEGDMRQAVPRSARSGSTREAPWLGSLIDSAASGGNSAVTFSRAGPEFNIEPASSGERLGYRWRDGTVEVLYWVGYDRPQDAQPASYALLTDVARFRLTYLARNNVWIESWPVTGDTDLPRAVRVELTLGSGETLERWLALRP